MHRPIWRICTCAAKGWIKDAEEAARWFSAAAQQGHTISQYNLGLIYEHGLGTDANDVEAVKWYYLASKGGHAKALSKLALLISLAIRFTPTPTRARMGANRI